MSDPADHRAALHAWLVNRFPDAEALQLSELRPPGAGESSDTQIFELDWVHDGRPEHLDGVLRCAPREPSAFPSYDLGMQFRVMEALGAAGVVPVPEVLWLEEDPTPLGVPFLVMRSVAGDAPLDRPSYQGEGFYHAAAPALRARIWERTLEALARLHEADWKSFAPGVVPGARTGEDPATQSLRYWRRYLQEWVKDEPEEVVPVFDEALDWLERERPEPSRLSLCWGDAKLGNVIYAPETREVAAIIDWEMATLGDPEQDLASLHLSDLRAQDEAGGVSLEGTPSAEEIVRLYERFSGRPVEHFHYQMVFATFWRGSVQLAVMRRLRAKGLPIPEELFVDNFPTRKLRSLLELS